MCDECDPPVGRKLAIRVNPGVTDSACEGVQDVGTKCRVEIVRHVERAYVCPQAPTARAIDRDQARNWPAGFGDDDFRSGSHSTQQLRKMVLHLMDTYRAHIGNRDNFRACVQLE